LSVFSGKRDSALPGIILSGYTVREDEKSHFREAGVKVKTYTVRKLDSVL